ncbi:POT family protein [Sarocladium implicatum]|nr:POT family protein [Sarocladium implicatum]
MDIGTDKTPGGDAIQNVNTAESVQLEKPSDAESLALRRVPDKMPKLALLILLGERFTYFGLSGPIQNYIKYVGHSPIPSTNPYDPGSDLPGALGKGQAVATALGNFFKFWAYTSTVIGAIVADQYLGKYRAILLAGAIYTCGLVILVATSTHAGITSGAGLGGLIAAMVTIGLGTGGIKANVTPMCAEQYANSRPMLKMLKSGEQVIVDPELTVGRLFMWFYWVVNIGALSPLITVTVEAHHSFCAIILSLVVFMLGRNKYIKVPPMGSAILDAIRTVRVAIQERSFDNAKPSALREHGHQDKYPIASQERYTDEYVGEVRTGLRSYVLVLPILFHLLESNVEQPHLASWPDGAARHSQRPSAEPGSHFVVYPLLRKYRINFDPVTRIFVGFITASLSMVYASVLQHYIYNSPPKSIHVWIQAPSYILVAFSEAFVIITGLELAFTQALRSVVSALFWLTIGIAAAICIALSAVSQDPYLVWMYGSLAIVGFVAGSAFYWCFYPKRK